jgi:hypothetical protein
LLLKINVNDTLKMLYIISFLKNSICSWMEEEKLNQSTNILKQCFNDVFLIF